MAKGLLLFGGLVLLLRYCDGSSLDAVGTDLEHLVRKTVTNGQKWLEDAHKEIGNIAQKNDKMQELDQEIVHFLTKARPISSIQDEEKKLDAMGEIFEELVRLSFKYDVSNVKYPDPELKTLADLLNRNGMDVFLNQFSVDFRQFTDKLIAVVEEHMTTMSATEKQKDIRRTTNLKRLKNERDLQKKFDIYLKL